MNTPQQLAKHLRDVHFGGNWTCVNLKDNLNGVTWQQATAKVQDCNTIYWSFTCTITWQPY